MSRSYAMQDIINTISSGEGSKILREYPDFLITHWFRPAHDNYKIAAVIESSDGKRSNKIITLSELAMTTCVRKPEKLQKLIDVLKKTALNLYQFQNGKVNSLKIRIEFYWQKVQNI